jgi:hypothetical protein
VITFSEIPEGPEGGFIIPDETPVTEDSESVDGV